MRMGKKPKKGGKRVTKTNTVTLSGAGTQSEAKGRFGSTRGKAGLGTRPQESLPTEAGEKGEVRASFTRDCWWLAKGGLG